MTSISRYKLILPSLLGVVFFVCGCMEKQPCRFGLVSQTKPGKLEVFKNLHSQPWPEVSAKLKKHHNRNYSIFLKQLEQGQQPYMFCYFEYAGDNFDCDKTRMKENPSLHRWIDMEEVFYLAGDTDTRADDSDVQRHGWVIGLRPEMVDAYKLLHKYAWPDVLDKLVEGHVRNYSIYLHELDGKYYLFSYLEYVGDDFNADMAMVDNDPATQAWMKFTDKGCQLPIPTRAEGEWWANMEEIFHHE